MPLIFQAHPCILTNGGSDNKELPQEPQVKRKRGRPRKDQQKAPTVTVPSQRVGQEVRAKRYCTRNATHAQPEKAAEPSVEEHESHEERKAEAPDSKQEPAEAKAEVRHESPEGKAGSEAPKAEEPAIARGLTLTFPEEEKIALWEVPSRQTWTSKLREEDQYGRLIDYLEGRDRPYRDSKERSMVEEMAKTHAVRDGILVTRKPV